MHILALFFLDIALTDTGRQRLVLGTKVRAAATKHVLLNEYICTRRGIHAHRHSHSHDTS